MYYVVEITENRHHSYVIEATSEDEAINKYQQMEFDDLVEFDLDGNSSWDSYPWNVEEASAEDMHYQLEKIAEVLGERERLAS